MNFTLVFVSIVAVLIFLANAQTNVLRSELADSPVIKINGIYRQSKCSCTAPQNCDENFDSLYTIIADTKLGLLEMSPYNYAFRSRLYGQFDSNVSGLVSFSVNGLSCDGTFIRGFSCVDNLQKEWCSLKMDCVFGGCFVSQVDKDLRTYLFPIVWSFVVALFISYVAYMQFGKITEEDTKIYIEAVLRFLSILQFVTAIFLLLGPTAYYGLFFLASACFYFHSRVHIRSDLLIDAILALFSMAMLGGQNFLTFTGGHARDQGFNLLASSFYNNTCFKMYGVPIGDDRCGLLLMFEMFATFFLLLIQAPIFLFSAYLVRFPVRNASSTILYGLYSYFVKEVPRDFYDDTIEVPLDKILGIGNADEIDADDDSEDYEVDEDNVSYVKLDEGKKKPKAAGTKKERSGKKSQKKTKKQGTTDTGGDTYKKM